MPANIRCPVGHKLMVPSRYSGRSVACPRCGVTFVVPAFDSPADSANSEKMLAEKNEAKPEKNALKKSPALRANTASEANAANSTVSSTIVAEPATAAVTNLASADSPNESPSATVYGPSQNPDPVGSPPTRGMQHPPHRIRAMYYLAAAIVGVAIFDMIPAFLDVVDYFRTGGTIPISTWAVALLFLGILQCVYAVYVAQLPDWSTARVATIMVMVLAMLYAMLLGSLLFGTEQSWLVQRLQLTDRLRNARLWCFLMLSLTGLIAYFAGRITVRWSQAERASFST